MGDVIQLDESRRQTPIADPQPIPFEEMTGLVNKRGEPVVLRTRKVPPPGQVVQVRFNNEMGVAFVNGVPWSYSALAMLTDVRENMPHRVLSCYLDTEGRIVRKMINDLGEAFTVSRDVGLDGQVEPMPGAPRTLPLAPVNP